MFCSLKLPYGGSGDSINLLWELTDSRLLDFLSTSSLV